MKNLTATPSEASDLLFVELRSDDGRLIYEGMLVPASDLPSEAGTKILVHVLDELIKEHG